MYVPATFAETDTAKLHEFMRQTGYPAVANEGRRPRAGSVGMSGLMCD